MASTVLYNDTFYIQLLLRLIFMMFFASAESKYSAFGCSEKVKCWNGIWGPNQRAVALLKSVCARACVKFGRTNPSSYEAYPKMMKELLDDSVVLEAFYISGSKNFFTLFVFFFACFWRFSFLEASSFKRSTKCLQPTRPVSNCLTWGGVCCLWSCFSFSLHINQHDDKSNKLYVAF